MSNETSPYKDILLIRYSRAEDASELVYSLREADVQELQHVGIHTPLEALQDGFRESDECFTVEYAGRPIAMFGVVKHPYELFSGCIWLLGSDRLMDFKREIVRQSKGWVDYFHSLYPRLGNIVWEGNTKHIRWLKWLGFEFSEPIPGIGPMNGTFFHFYKEQINV